MATVLTQPIIKNAHMFLIGKKESLHVMDLVDTSSLQYTTSGFFNTMDIQILNLLLRTTYPN